MTSLSFFIQVILGTTFYGLDVYTDIKFSVDMIENSWKNFGAEMTKCLNKFDGKFDLAIEVCKLHFNKQACMAALAEVRRTSAECFENEQRFTDNIDWRIAGAVCAAHCIIPILASLILWEVIQRGVECCNRSWTKLPIPFVTKFHKFMLEKKLFKNYAWTKRNESKETEKKYEDEKKKCKEDIEAYENVVVLSLVVEASLEASFQVSNVIIISQSALNSTTYCSVFLSNCLPPAFLGPEPDWVHWIRLDTSG